ncbi:MAG TPA: FtsW/RodA/SpoVE family cell cycle protein [Armatimonadota bacterium]|nr:FtsW/RodA/SpoVE family cell cycle protein [Armatimonadota bacterium]
MRFGEGRFIKHMDFRMVAAALALLAIGTVLVVSTPVAEGRLARQLAYAAAGVAVLVVAIHVDYDFIRNAYYITYALNILVLLLVLAVGHTAGGATSWFHIGPISIQPSEFSKLALIITLAAYMADRGAEMRNAGPFLLSFAEVVLPPVALIVAQRDLGTSLVCIAIWLTVMYTAGCRWNHLALFVLGGLVLFGMLWKYHVMPAEQLSRITGWLMPYRDPTGDGYHYITTQATIGAGGWLGLGFRHGPMTQNQIVPHQDTDMVFSVLGEEWGLAGCTVVLVLYGFLVWRGFSTVAEAKNDLGRYVAAGVTGMLLCHVVVNISMQIRLLPITGIPLPLLSSGGSNLTVTMAALGLLINVHMRRKKLTF